MNGTRTHATDPMAPAEPTPGVKRKLPDDSNPLLAAATKRLKKEVGVLHNLAVSSPSSTTGKLGRVQTETCADFLGCRVKY